MSIKNNLASIKVTGALQSSTPIIASLNDLVKVPELRETCKQMSKEFAKAGIIEETIGDAIDDAVGVEGEDEIAEAAVNQVLQELTLGAMSGAKTVGSKTAGTKEADKEMETETLRQRLDAIK
eukprot:gnl/Chilomastix_caulleri/521.p1 GENE.gnl/Chilomastix_caulleri/521~~gnl/Chilomastix_caulleri/521.p1  ORF type:complete len:123 (+),score=38.31 gnl/Chilomastix_caulleri/521:302-670(+)